MLRLARWATACTLVLLVGVTRPAGAQDATPATGDLTVPTVDFQALDRYLRALPPDTLIRIAFADTPVTQRMLDIACREAGLGKTRKGCDGPRAPGVAYDPSCSAANPGSSARGLFQTLSGWSGLAGQIGLSWARVVGPDCLDDVLLARAIYARSGLHPWQ